MSDAAKIRLIWIGTVAILFVWFGLIAPSLFSECRDAGHSVLYCVRQVVR